MSGAISRKLYRQIIRLYPEPFRCEFAEEMLGVFDECRGKTRTSYLLADGLAAAFRQQLHFLATPAPAATPLYSEVPSSPPLARALATAVFAVALVSGVFTRDEAPVPHYSPRVRVEHSTLYVWWSSADSRHNLVRSRFRKSN